MWNGCNLRVYSDLAGWFHLLTAPSEYGDEAALYRQLLESMGPLRLDRRFDAVFVHDAIDYLINLDDLRAAMATAYMHLHPGGVALLCPSRLRESFAPAQNTAATTKEREGSATSSGHGTRSPPTRHTSSTSQPNCWWQGCSSCYGSRFHPRASAPGRVAEVTIMAR
jgi:hypothetical protein